MLIKMDKLYHKEEKNKKDHSVEEIGYKILYLQ